MWHNGTMPLKSRLQPKGSRNCWEPCKIGTIGELHIAIDLMERGFEPYMPLPGRQAKHDMLAYDIETGAVYPVSVKTSSDENGNGSGDPHTARDGGIVATVRYRLPKGVVRRVSSDPIPTESGVLERQRHHPDPYQGSQKQKVVEQLEAFDAGTELESHVIIACFPHLPRRTIHRGIVEAVEKNIIKRKRWGVYVRL